MSGDLAELEIEDGSALGGHAHVPRHGGEAGAIRVQQVLAGFDAGKAKLTGRAGLVLADDHTIGATQPDRGARNGF